MLLFEALYEARPSLREWWDQIFSDFKGFLFYLTPRFRGTNSLEFKRFKDLEEQTINIHQTLFAGSKRRRGVSARPSRQPRVPFTPFQQATLENKFQIDHYLTSNAVNELSVVLNLPEQRIKIWFQNRRARERREGQLKAEMSTEISTDQWMV